jgi:hypothetical protein
MEDRAQGGLTGATGSLTPSDPDDEFVPAETRAINDPHASRRDSAETQRRADDRDQDSVEAGPSGAAGPVLGGDERRDPEEEHL